MSNTICDELGEYLTENASFDNFSDRYFFVKMAQALHLDSDLLKTILSSDHFQISQESVYVWSKAIEEKMLDASPYLLATIWLHSAALSWDCRRGMSERLEALSIRCANYYCDKFGHNVPVGWVRLLDLYRFTESAHLFKESINLNIDVDTYILTHRILVETRYFSGNRILIHQEKIWLERILSTALKPESGIVKDIHLECALILHYYCLIDDVQLSNLIFRAKMSLGGLAFNQSPVRERYHFILLFVLLEACLVK